MIKLNLTAKILTYTLITFRLKNCVSGSLRTSNFAALICPSVKSFRTFWPSQDLEAWSYCFFFIKVCFVLLLVFGLELWKKRTNESCFCLFRYSFHLLLLVIFRSLFLVIFFHLGNMSYNKNPSPTSSSASSAKATAKYLMEEGLCFSV